MIGEDEIRAAAAVLKDGGAVVFPTDTVYGLGVAVSATDSPVLLHRMKGRDEGKPIAWLVADEDSLLTYAVDIPTWAVRAARRFWPGPLTLVVRAGDRVPKAFRSQDGTIGLRMPDHPVALDLIRAVGCPIATTSANVSGQAPPSRFDEVDCAALAHAGAFLQVEGAVAGTASTVVDVTHGKPVVLREGKICLADLEGLLC